MNKNLFVSTSFVLLALVTPADAGEMADTIYHGDVLTMAEDPSMAEALAVKDGKILAVGNRLSIDREHKGDATRVVELRGKCIVPGFIDPHSHFFNALGMRNQANVAAPPVGPAAGPRQIVAELKKFAAAHNIEPGALVIGYGYDENLMPKGRPLTRDDLDAAFPDNPVLVMHVSLHGAVLNTAAMKKYGISAETETPPGGVIVRKPGSNEPAGLVMETAFLPIFERLPAPTPEEEAEQLEFAQMLYAAAGVTTANEGATNVRQLEILQRGAAGGKLFIDVIALPFIGDLEKILAKNPAGSFGKYAGGLKLGGCKITADGSPQAKTAYFTTPYLTGGPGGEKDWRGEPTFPQEVLNGMVKKCYDEGLQTFVHANGDAAIDMVLKAHEYAAGDDPAAERRTTIVHSQFVRKDQLEKYVEYKLIPSFYTEHAFFFGDTHRLNRGVRQADFLSPMRTARRMGLRPTNHTDFNVAPIDQMLLLWTAVNRRSRTGELIGSDERISILDALRAITIDAAYQYGEEKVKGSIEPGKLADLVILDTSPLVISPGRVLALQVLETIKEGKTIFATPRREPIAVAPATQ